MSGGMDSEDDRKDTHRQSGTIDYIKGPYKEDHGILTLTIGIDLDNGGSQGFGGLCFKEGLEKLFVAEVCYTFNVDRLEQLKGKRCWVFYSFVPTWGETIEGIGCLKTGRRFTITGFQRRHCPDLKTTDKLEYAKESARREIEWARRRIKEEEQKLLTLESRYRDWESHPDDT